MDPPIVSMSPRMSPGAEKSVSFAPDVREPVGPTEAKEHKESHKSCGWSAGYGVLAILFWTVIIFGITFVVLMLINPGFVHATNSTAVDYGKVSLAALIVALTGVIIIWLIRSCSHSAKKHD